jgi:hypothetical protein
MAEIQGCRCLSPFPTQCLFTLTSSATPAGVGFSGMPTGGGDHFVVLPPANMLSSLRDDQRDARRIPAAIVLLITP